MSTPNGFLILDKPPGITSRRAVDLVQKVFPRGTRIGHAGTLDPLATGVLVVAVGQATRLIEFVQRMQKEYHAVITLGATSDTDDADGTIVPTSDLVIPRADAIEQTLQTFLGEIDQVPPAYSAAHVDGRRAHDLARRGKPVDLAPRKVHIHEIRLLNVSQASVEVTVRCGKGTYIRSLARDLGTKLRCGGYISVLRRTRIGTFALPGLDVNTLRKGETVPLGPIEAALSELRQASPEESTLRALRQGQWLPGDALPIPVEAGEAAVLNAEGKLHAIVSWDPQRRAWMPGKVFVSPS